MISSLAVRLLPLCFLIVRTFSTGRRKLKEDVCDILVVLLLWCFHFAMQFCFLIHIYMCVYICHKVHVRSMLRIKTLRSYSERKTCFAKQGRYLVLIRLPLGCGGHCQGY